MCISFTINKFQIIMEKDKNIKKKEEEEEEESIQNLIKSCKCLEICYNDKRFNIERFKKILHEHIKKFNLTENVVNRIFTEGSMTGKYVVISYFEEMLYAILETGYKFTPKNYTLLLSHNIRVDGWSSRIPQFKNKNIFNDLELNYEMIKEIMTEKINDTKYYNFDKINIIPLDSVDLKKNGKYLLTFVNSLERCEKLIYEYNIKVMREIIFTRRKYDFDRECYKKINNFIESKFEGDIEVGKLNENLNDLDLQFINFKNIDEVENFSQKYEYEINTRAFLIACQNDMNTDILIKLLSYKVNLEEKDVNNIIRNLCANPSLHLILSAIVMYGYQMTQSNYYEVAKIRCNDVLNEKKIMANFIFDDKFLDTIAKNNYLKPDIFIDNLISIIKLNQNHENNIENLFAYCFTKMSLVGIKKIMKKYKLKITLKCLKYSMIYETLFYGMDKIFIDNNIKPDIDILRTFIESFSGLTPGKHNKYSNIILSL
jgi:hypothetical protein